MSLNYSLPQAERSRTQAERSRMKQKGANMKNEHLEINIKAARVNAGISKKQAAAAAGISKKQLDKWERNSGKIKLDKAAILANLYGIPLNNIWFGKVKEYHKRIAAGETVVRLVES